MVAHKRSPSRSNGKNKRPPDAGRRKPPSEIVRKGIEEDLPAVPPTADEVDWLVAWLLQHAAAFSGRRGRGRKPQRLPAAVDPIVDLEERFLGFVAGKVRQFEQELLLAVAPAGRTPINLRRGDLLRLSLHARLVAVFDTEKAMFKNRAWGKTDGRTWRRLQCFELAGLPLLNQDQENLVADFPIGDQTARQAATALIEALYRSERHQKAAAKHLRDLLDSDAVGSAELGYPGPPATHRAQLRYILGDIFMHGPRIVEGTLSGYEAAQEQAVGR